MPASSERDLVQDRVMLVEPYPPISPPPGSDSRCAGWLADWTWGDVTRGPVSVLVSGFVTNVIVQLKTDSGDLPKCEPG